jgi:hypothetical protein
MEVKRELCRAFPGIYTRTRTRAESMRQPVTEHPHLTLMRRTLDAFRSGDMPTLAGIFRDYFHPEHLWDAFRG